jgi:hypothetical protein
MMTEGSQAGRTTRFVLISVKHDAGYWTPDTIARELMLKDMLVSPSEAELDEFRDEVLGGLVGRAAEKFWASDAVTPANAAAIRAACRALHSLTLEVFEQVAGELSLEKEAGSTPETARRGVKPAP